MGYATLWTALVSFPMMTAVQFTCAKIGMVSGTGLAAVLRQRFPRAAGLRRGVRPGGRQHHQCRRRHRRDRRRDQSARARFRSTLLIVPIGAAILALQIWGSYKVIARVFKWLTLGSAGVHWLVAVCPSRLD